MLATRWVRQPLGWLCSCTDTGSGRYQGSSLTSKPATVSSYCTQPSEPTNYYDILEVTPKASHRLIKTSYYRLSKTYHPDVNKSADAQEQFSRVAEAYEVLGSAEQRRFYDQSLLSRTRPESYQTQSPFGQSVFNKKNKPPTGRSHIYNFDEFYRQHYGEARMKQQDAREYWEEEMAKDKDFRNQQKRMAATYMFTLIGVVGFMLLKKRI